MLCVKVRNFLPQSYIENVNKSKSKSIKRVIYYLVIFNMFILPLNINSDEKDIVTKEQKIDSYNLKGNYKNVTEDLLKWLSIDTNIIKNINVHDNIGEVTIDKKEKAYYLESVGFKINEVKHIGDDIVVKLRNGGDIN